MAGADQGAAKLKALRVKAKSTSRKRTLRRELAGFDAFNVSTDDLDDSLRRVGSIVLGWRETMDWMDGLYLGLSVLFFGLTWAFVKLCERV